MRLGVVALGLTGCLSLPGPPGSDDGSDRDDPDAGPADAAVDGGSDAPPGGCALERHFVAASELEGWDRNQVGDEDCACDVIDGAARFSSTDDDEPCQCNFTSPAGLLGPFAGQVATITFSQPGGGLAAAFGLYRPTDAYVFTRSRTSLSFGTCVAGECENAAFGSVTFDAETMHHWRFAYDAVAAELVYQTSPDGESFVERARAPLAIDALGERQVNFGVFETGGFLDVIEFDDLTVCPAAD